MFTIYSELEIFENMVVFNDKNPNWYNIFCNHSDVCLNITDDELIEQQLPGTIIFEFILSNGGRSPIALKNYFDAIYEDNSIMMEKPRSSFFLNIKKEEADKLQESLGVIIQSYESIDDNIFKGTSHCELPANQIIHSNNLVGWKCLFNFQLPPSNAIVITDDWLFKNEEHSVIVGERNTVDILNAMLPLKLDGIFHLLVISDDQNRSEQRCQKLAIDLKESIAALRQYQILVEVVFAETIHKRKIFTNYISITCDKGFAMFRVNDNSKVRDDNDFRYEFIFNRINPNEGDPVAKSDYILLTRIKSKCKSVVDHIITKGQDHNQRIYCDCNPDKSIVNRLINDV